MPHRDEIRSFSKTRDGYHVAPSSGTRRKGMNEKAQENWGTAASFPVRQRYQNSDSEMAHDNPR